MKNNKRVIVTWAMIISALAFTFAAAAMALQFSPSRKIGFVDNARLFEGFEGKKESEKKLIRLQQRHQSVLDSMRLSTGAQPAAESAARYNRVEAEFSRNLAEQGEAFTTQVWNQINESVREYGELNGYALIHGAAGNGSLMYADPDRDITEKVLEFINQRYAGL